MGKSLSTVTVMRRGPRIPAPLRKAAHHLPTLFGKLAMERWLSTSRAVPTDLELLAQLRAGSLVGCHW